MASQIPPQTMKAWQYGTIQGKIEDSLKLNASATVPQPKPDQHLVQIAIAALNPVDYKPAEVYLLRRFAIPKFATPGIDYVGRIVTPAAGSPLKPGQLVFGVAGTTPFAGAALAEYAIVTPEGAVPVPEGLSATDAASIGVAGLTAHQSFVPFVKPSGSRLFINGGSGGTGVFAIQLAKASGHHVTTSCSGANVELCKSLGADEVIDYKEQSVLQALETASKQHGAFDHVVDNVGSDYSLYWQSHTYTKSSAAYMNIAASPTFSYFSFKLQAKLLPVFLGGAKRKLLGLLAQPKPDQLQAISKLMVEGKVKAVIDSKFDFDGVPDAFRKLKTGRARGKILVEVAPDVAKQ